jgi:hypothetical protein
MEAGKLAARKRYGVAVEDPAVLWRKGGHGKACMESGWPVPRVATSRASAIPAEPLITSAVRSTALIKAKLEREAKSMPFAAIVRYGINRINGNCRSDTAPDLSYQAVKTELIFN